MNPKFMYKFYSENALILNALLIAAIITFMGFPGQMSYDSFYTLREAREGVSGGSYPPMHAYIFRFFDAIYPGPLLLWVAQNVLFVLSLAIIIDRALLIDLPYKTALLCLILFIPPVLGPMLTVWKDVLLTSLLTCSVAIVVYSRGNISRYLRLVFFVLAYTALVLASCIRLNALSATIPLLYIALRESSRKGTRLVFLTFLTLCAVMVGTAFYLNNFKFMTLERFNPANNFVRAPTTWIFLYDIIGVAKYSKHKLCFSNTELDCISSECADTVFSGNGITDTLEGLARCGPSDREAIHRNMDYDRLKPLWKSVVTEELYPYLSARIEYVSSLLAIGGKRPYQISQNETPLSTAISLPSTSPGDQSGVSWDSGLERSRLPAWVVRYLKFFSNGLGIKAWLVLIVAALISTSRFFLRRTVSNLSLAILASVAGYFIPFVFIGADAGVRYLHWVLVGSALAAILVVAETNDQG